MSDIVERLREVADIKTGILYSRRKMLNDAADELTRLRTALSEAEQRMNDASVPEGWQLVPKQPTPTMAFAGINAVVKGQKYDTPSDPLFAADLAACNGDKGAVRAMQNYRAMLATAPALIPSEPHDAEGRE